MLLLLFKIQVFSVLVAATYISWFSKKVIYRILRIARVCSYEFVSRNRNLCINYVTVKYWHRWSQFHFVKYLSTKKSEIKSSIPETFGIEKKTILKPYLKSAIDIMHNFFKLIENITKFKFSCLKVDRSGYN